MAMSALRAQLWQTHGDALRTLVNATVREEITEYVTKWREDEVRGKVMPGTLYNALSVMTDALKHKKAIGLKFPTLTSEQKVEYVKMFVDMAKCIKTDKDCACPIDCMMRAQEDKTLAFAIGCFIGCIAEHANLMETLDAGSFEYRVGVLSVMGDCKRMVAKFE